MEQPEFSYIAGRAVKWYNHLGNQLGSFLKLIIHFPYDPATLLMNIYARQMKTYVYEKNLFKDFTVALFIIVQNWKQPKCPLSGE